MTNQITTMNQDIRPLTPGDVPGLMELAKIMLDSGFMPKHITKPSQLIVLSQAGAAVGLTMLQSVQGFMMVNDKPAPYGDTQLSIVRASGTLEYIKEEIVAQGKDMKARCTVQRKGEKEPIVREFSVEDAIIAKLWGKPGPWTLYPKRMLQMRARTFALRDGFSDKLNGISYTVEELQDGAMLNVTPAETETKFYDAPEVVTVHTGSNSVDLCGVGKILPMQVLKSDLFELLKKMRQDIDSHESFVEHDTWWRSNYPRVKGCFSPAEADELGDIYFKKKNKYYILPTETPVE